VKIFENIKEDEKIIVYGAGVIAKALIQIICACPEILKRTVGCAVTYVNQNETEIEGIPVYVATDILEKHPDAYVIIAVREMYKKAVIGTLEELHIKRYSDINMAECIEALECQWINKYSNERNVSAFLEHKQWLNDEDYLMFLSKQMYNGKLDFEVNLVDHCNLNCQCCNHFSPLAEKYFLDCVQYERDLKRISELFGGRIGTLTLVGGEPLLHPEIVKIMQISRRILCSAEISIISNGLLLGKMEEEFWKKCKEWDIHIVLTKYPINFNYEELEEKALIEGVALSYTYASQEIKTTWHLPLKENGDLNPYKNFMKCYHANKCIVLREGRLYTCPICANVHMFNNYFDKNMPEGKENSIDIYEAVSMEQIQHFLSLPIPMCKHCDIYNYTYDIPWQTSKKQLSEWT